MPKARVAQPLLLVVTCANRKQHAVAPDLRLGSLSQRRTAARFAAWTARLTGSTQPRHRALDLYAGEHWKVARTLTAAAPAGTKATLWIASAGYGLLPAEAAISAYGATFSAGRDTVGPTLADVTNWWHRLGDWPGPMPDQPRTFTELARRTPDAQIVAVLSGAYQRACARDLLAAAAVVGPDALSIVGPPMAQRQLTDLLVPVTAVQQPTVGGSLQALNVRIARHLLAHGAGGGRSALREAAAAATPSHAPARRLKGRGLSDAEVRDYIRAQPHTSATQLLRRLRDTGQSCEQARFGRLHAQVCRQGHLP